MLAKATMKSSNKELTNYIRAMLKSLAVILAGSGTLSIFNPTTEEMKNLLVKIQQERHFGNIGRAWIVDLKD